MDLYQTDTTFQPINIIDNFESCVWTDRYDEHGDFVLVIPWSYALANALKTFKYLVQSESDRIMMVETVSQPRDIAKKDGNLVKITGRSLEAFLYFRDHRWEVDGDPSVLKTGSQGAIINSIINDTCLISAQTDDNLPGLVLGTPPSSSSRTLTIPRGNVYDMVQPLCKAENYGFKWTRTLVSGQSIWQVYQGVDRSVAGPNYREFSPDNDTLVDVNSLESVANYKNRLRMIGAKAGVTVTKGTVTGFNRRMAVIDATDIGPDTTTTVSEDQTALIYRTSEVFRSDEHKYVQYVDGELAQGVAHDLGDIVVVQNSFGVKSAQRITEKIWTSDVTGTKRIPTFEAL